MTLFQQISRPTKVLLASGILLTLYGYLCRLAGIYFFWESRYIGWLLLFLSSVVLFIKVMKPWVQERNHKLMRNIGVIIIVMVLGLGVFVTISFHKSDALVAAKDALAKDDSIIKEVGTVIGFDLLPTGALQTTETREGVSGDARFELIVKGDEKYRDVIVYLHKDIGDEEWRIVKLIINYI